MSDKSDSQQAIAAFNQSYLLFAQRMLGQDPERAKHVLGLSDSIATRISSLTAGEIETIANSPDLVCVFRFDVSPGQA